MYSSDIYVTEYGNKTYSRGFQLRKTTGIEELVPDIIFLLIKYMGISNAGRSYLL